MTATKYGGHVRAWDKPQPAEFAPAATRDNKFTSMAPGFEYNKQLPRRVSPFQSFMSLSTANVKEGMYRRPDRRGVEAAYDADKTAAMMAMAATKAPFIPQSVYNTTYMDSRSIVDALLRMTDAEFEAAFSRALYRKHEAERRRLAASRAPSPSSPTRAAGNSILSGLMVCADYSQMIDHNERDCGLFLGMLISGPDSLDPVEAPVLAVSALLAATAGEERLSWDSIARALPRFRECLVTSGTSHPPASCKPSAVSLLANANGDVVPLSQMRSCTDMDMNVREPTATTTRVLALANTRDMDLGTTRATLHPPGYCGHIPTVQRGGLKAEHSIGVRTRPMQLDLLLTTKLSTSGYTGVMSRYVNSGQERVTGTDTRTTSGAAAAGLIL